MNAAYSALTGGGPTQLQGAVPQAPGDGSGMLSGLTNSRSLGAMQLGMSTIGALGGMAAGSATNQAYESAAASARIESTGALEQGASQVAGLRQQLTQTLGQRTVMAGAGGVDVGQGIAHANRNTLTSRVATQSGIDLMGSQINSTKYQINALNDQLMGERAKLGGMSGLLGLGAGVGLKLLGI